MWYCIEVCVNLFFSLRKQLPLFFDFVIIKIGDDMKKFLFFLLSFMFCINIISAKTISHVACFYKILNPSGDHMTDAQIQILDYNDGAGGRAHRTRSVPYGPRPGSGHVPQGSRVHQCLPVQGSGNV